MTLASDLLDDALKASVGASPEVAAARSWAVFQQLAEVLVDNGRGPAWYQWRVLAACVLPIREILRTHPHHPGVQAVGMRLVGGLRHVRDQLFFLEDIRAILFHPEKHARDSIQAALAVITKPGLIMRVYPGLPSLFSLLAVTFRQDEQMLACILRAASFSRTMATCYRWHAEFLLELSEQSVFLRRHVFMFMLACSRFNKETLVGQGEEAGEEGILDTMIAALTYADAEYISEQRVHARWSFTAAVEVAVDEVFAAIERRWVSSLRCMWISQCLAIAHAGFKEAPVGEASIIKKRHYRTAP